MDAINTVNSLTGKPLITQEVIDYNKKNTYEFAERYKTGQVVEVLSEVYLLVVGGTKVAIMKAALEGAGGAEGGSYSQGRPTEAQGFSSKGYNPQPGERTFNGYVKQNANPEVSLYTKSAGFNSNNGIVGGEFKRFGAESHGGVSPHVHQPIRNVAPNGNVFGGVGTKTYNGGVTSPAGSDIKQLYQYLNNGKYY